MVRGIRQHIHSAAPSARPKATNVSDLSKGNPIFVPSIRLHANTGDVSAGPSTRTGPQMVEEKPTSAARRPFGTALFSINAPEVPDKPAATFSASNHTSGKSGIPGLLTKHLDEGALETHKHDHAPVPRGLAAHAAGEWETDLKGDLQRADQLAAAAKPELGELRVEEQLRQDDEDPGDAQHAADSVRGVCAQRRR